MSTVPHVAIAPPPRCFYRGIDRCGPVCGRLATHMRRGRDWFSTEYVCELHVAPGDVEIPAERVFRRVRVWADIYFAGALQSAPMSHTECVARLETAVRDIGGALEVNDVRSDIVSSMPQAPPGWQLTGKGSRE
jgi:hypothetical protein